jgi:hypothetical protein
MPLNRICECKHLENEHVMYARACSHNGCKCEEFKEEEKPRIPEFIELLEQSKAIHLKKNRDYANADNPFSNFERSAELVSWFTNKNDKSFVALIGNKLARIAELSDGRQPNNESLDDSFLDLLTYIGLWAAYVKRNRK